MPRTPFLPALAGVAVLGLAMVVAGSTSATAAQTATTISGPVGLGTAATFGVLGGAAVTNTGPSVIGGDLGVSPGTSITGFPPGIASVPQTAVVSAQAQADTGTAYDVAASLSPTTSGLTDLVGLTLVPGVYSGGDLSLSGTLTLAGSASSVWVFQAASTLITSSASSILMTGGASSCNVFWQVGSSATLGTASTMVGTVMAMASITSATGTTVQGRLLARTGAVTLDDTTIIQPAGCTTAAGTVATSPTITSTTVPGATVGAPFAFRLAAVGTGPTTFAVAGGVLPTGVSLNSATGAITGTPMTAGVFTSTVTAANGVAPAASMTVQITVTALLAETGTTTPAAAPFALASVLAGFVLVLLPRSRRRATRH
jgi:hypothetical protein